MRAVVEGDVFGRLTALSPLGKDRKSNALVWLFQCSCGNLRPLKVTAVQRDAHGTKSCGCLRVDLARTQALIRNSMSKGKNHPNYNPKITDAERELRKTNRRSSDLLMQAARAKAFARDKQRCQGCGNKGEVTHHIKPWTFFKRHRYTVWNLVVLCKVCHKHFHHCFGYRNPHNHKNFAPWLRRRRAFHGHVRKVRA